MNICEKAKDRVDRKEHEEKYLELCFKYLICPTCGDDMNLLEISPLWNSPGYAYRYKCLQCGWKGQIYK